MSAVFLLPADISSHTIMSTSPGAGKGASVTQYLHPYFPGHWELPAVDNYYIHVTFLQPTTYKSIVQSHNYFTFCISELNIRRLYYKPPLSICYWIVDISLFKIFVEYNMQCRRWPGVDSRQCVDELIHLFAGSK